MENENKEQAAKEVAKKFELTDEDIKAHFKHQCEAGYDPLLCVNRLVTWIDLRTMPITGSFDAKTRQFCCHHDRVIDEARYIELIHRAGIKTKDKLDDIIYIPWKKVLHADPTIIDAKAAIFWLHPLQGMRTLTDLYQKYEKKIKGELHIEKSPIIIP